MDYSSNGPHVIVNLMDNTQMAYYNYKPLLIVIITRQGWVSRRASKDTRCSNNKDAFIIHLKIISSMKISS
jgi:hypothetical protein